MKKRYFPSVILLAVAFVFGIGNCLAQQDTTKMKQEVEVTKAYQPTISGAVKINDIPKVVSEPTETPTFDYSIFSKPVFSTIEVTPVAAAKMVGEPKPEMGMGQLSLGFGNYLTPYGEFFFNSKPDKNSTFGMHFKHLSSSGNINLLNGDNVKAPESVNSAEIFGQHFFRSSTLTGSLAYDRQAFTYYGYTGDLLTDVEKSQMIPWFGKKQYFSKGTANVDLKSETKSAYDLSYDFNTSYHYLVTKTGQSESQFVLTGDLSKKFDKTIGILNSSITVYKADSIRNNSATSIGPNNQVLLKFNPSAKWASDNASFQLGFNSTLLSDDGEVSIMVWPKVKAEWSPVENILTMFAGIDGHLQHNTYSAIAAENPYADPYHKVANANFKYIYSGGFKGRIGSKTNYVAQASYSMVKDQHFYITESESLFYLGILPRRLNNTFNWLYDDVNILKLSGEVLHTVTDNFSLHLSGNYYSYDLKTQTNAWGMPNYDLTFSGIYKPTEELRFTADIFVIGKRTAVIMDNSPLSSSSLPVNHEIAMGPIIDLNAGVNYQFSKPLSFFVKVNNFGIQKYEQWLGYTSKSFNWLAGISYSF